MRLSPAPVTAWHFTLLRTLLGLYLAVHFAALVPWAAEVFGPSGVFPDPAASPLHGLFPNPLNRWGDTRALQLGLAGLAATALLFACGVARRAGALALWFGWACLLHRNPLIANPSIPYVGLLLLATLLVPLGEPLGWRRRSSEWRMPASVYAVVGFLLAAGYTYSGLVKLGSPRWVDGSTLAILLDNPLARTGPARDVLLSLPPLLLRLATWGALAVEILTLPLALSRRWRPLAWYATTGLQLGILVVFDFTDLTLGMLLAHALVVDPLWLRGLVPYGMAGRLRAYRSRSDRPPRAPARAVAGSLPALSVAPTQGRGARRQRARLPRLPRPPG